jgi:flagellar FliL protein
VADFGTSAATTLCMASSAENTEAPGMKVPILPLMMVCVVAAVLAAAGCGGVMLFLAKKGKFGLGAAPVVVEAKKEVEATHPVVLDPMLVNLADDDGHAYLRVSIVLQETDEADPKDGKDKKKEGAEAKPVAGANAALRDTILDVLGKQKSPALLDPEGKEHLKDDLKDALDKEVPEAKVTAVYFTDFLVQR